jgi:hypothetical protein
MARPKGQPKSGGRVAGTPNKITTALKEAILAAADQAHPQGKVGYLTWLATNNSGAFASLLGRVLPMTISGDPDHPLEHKHHNATDAERAAAVMALIAKAK